MLSLKDHSHAYFTFYKLFGLNYNYKKYNFSQFEYMLHK